MAYEKWERRLVEKLGGRKKNKLGGAEESENKVLC